MSEAKFCSGSRLSGFIQCCGRGGTLLEGEGGGGGGALLEGVGGGKYEAVEAGGAALRVGGGPLGQLAGHLAGAVVVQAGQNIRETPFHPCKSKHFLRFFLIFER